MLNEARLKPKTTLSRVLETSKNQFQSAESGLHLFDLKIEASQLPKISARSEGEARKDEQRISCKAEMLDGSFVPWHV